MSGSPDKPYPNSTNPPSSGWGRDCFIIFFLLFVGFSGTVMGQEPYYTHDLENSLNLDYFTLTLADAGNPDAKLNRFIIAVEVNGKGERFVLTYGNGIKRVGDNDGLIDFIPNQDNRLSNPMDFAINSEGKFFVTTNESNRRFIRVYSPEGVYLQSETLGNGEYGSGADKFRGPVGLTFDKNDNLYVADHYIGDANPQPTNPSFIKIYFKDAAGNYKNNLLKEFDKVDGTLLNFPYRLAVNSQGHLYVAELGQDNNAKVKILQFDAAYNPTQISQTSDVTNQEGSPGSIIIDNFDNIFVADLGDLDFSRVLKATNDVDEFYAIFEIIKKGIKNDEFNIKIYNPDNSYRSTISAGIDLPIDLTISECGNLYVLNTIIDGTIRTFFGQPVPDINVDFDLEVYKRSSGYDTEPPVLGPCPGNIIVDVDPDQNYATVTYLTPTATDNCSEPLITQTGPVSGSQFQAGTTTKIEFIATDDDGNFSKCSFTITVNPVENEPDTEDPVIICPSNILQNVDANLCGAVMNYDIPSATDNSGEATVILVSGFAPGEIFQVGTTTVTYRAEDAAGNTAECSFEVTITDNIDPTIACPADINQNVETGVTGKIINYNLPSFADNCADPTIEQTAGLPSGSKFPLGTTTNTFVVTDASGNTAPCSFTVTISENADTEDPVLSCTSGIAQDVDANLCGAVVNYSTPTATDNSGEVIVTIVSGLAPGEVFPVGTTTVTYRAEDPAGNTDECSFEITVTDNIDPIISCPEDQIENYDPAVGFTVPDYKSFADISDNCEVASVTQTPVHGSIINQSTEVILTATDEAGNTTQCKFMVNLTEEEVLEITCQEDITEEITGTCNFVIPDYTNRASTNFAGAAITQIPAIGTVVTTNTTIVLTATLEGETDSCSFELILKDTENPIITCPSDQNQTFDPTLGFEVPDYRTSANPSDNCLVVWEQIPAAGTVIFESKRIEISATDPSGNIAWCSFVLNLTEEKVLKITCVEDQTVRLTTSCSFILPDYTGDAETNFEGATVVQTPSAGTVITSNTTVRLMASLNGETDECTFEVVLNDIVAPEIRCIDNNTEFVLTNGSITLSPSDLDAGSTDNCSFTFTLSQSTFTAIGTYSVTLRATDGNDNYTECTRNIKIVEPGQANRPPVAGDDEYTVVMNNVLSIPAPGLLSNDSDADGDALTANLQSNVTNGTLSLNANGSFTYTPNNNFVGDDVFTYVANDGTLNSNIAKVIIRVTGEEPEEPEEPGEFEEFIYIYPNPTTGPVNFYVPKSKKIERVELYDIRGRFIMKKEFPEGTIQYEMDLTGLQNSVYILNIITDSGYRIIRVIVK